MKRHILFIHSAGSQGMNEGSSNLVAYLKHTLGTACELLYPIMPQPENPRYNLWKTKLEKVLAVPEGQLILIGHSLGGSVLLKYLSENEIRKPVSGLLLIATPYWGKAGWDIDEFMLNEDFAKRLSHVPRIHLYHSRGDEVVPFDHLGLYRKKLPQAKVSVIEGAEHAFNKGLPEAVRDIKRLINDQVVVNPLQ